jgi:hypothetical protein
MVCCIFLAAMMAFLRDPRAMARRSSRLVRCLVLLLGAVLGTAVYVDVWLLDARATTPTALAGGALLTVILGVGSGRVLRHRDGLLIAVGCTWGWLLLSLGQMHVLHAGPTWTSPAADLTWHAAGAVFGALLWMSSAVTSRTPGAPTFARPSVPAPRPLGRPVA